ncbi:hypothetical protein P152DRAFT_457953 [Eremomyces bilateralis CBS 781.70]|uniref:Uncharacterized protein n=1 Tax=Eremomyces bilateralis CBS 781.70 TaxID=1392243 RepID=A0A6G1G3V9_9PEZI|nr:uncharacterized protein P152DRAFT_457953 [Eremomyces bilateralis CBS 781.70]KAF1812754.1 hypothetical protein P152DRAFT_457953 [Eremomyces bilateralis CBS 781.70]
MKKRVEEQVAAVPSTKNEHESRERGRKMERTSRESSQESIGPVLPEQSGRGKRSGPAIPTAQDLALRSEIAAEDRHDSLQAHRAARKSDRALQTARLDELAPRADANTRERALEKRADTTAMHRTFADRRSPGAAEVGEGELMGDDGIEGYRVQKKEEERKKTEREVRKEEMWRARAEERAERLERYQDKERGTMEMLRALAKERFG